MSSLLRIGIVGARRGGAFVEAIHHHPATQLVALCDTNAARLAASAPAFGSPATFTDYSAMLEAGLDLVIIATPLQWHVLQAVEALARGVHVFSEVPAASSLAQCDELVQAVRHSSARYMMGENCCYMKPHMLVKNMARAGVFGELYYAEGEYVHYVPELCPPGSWRAEYLLNRRGGTYLTHALGPILEWMDDRVVTVSCVGTGSWGKPEFTGDNCSVLLCRTAKGALISLRNDLRSPRPFSGYAALQGTKGAYVPNWDGAQFHRIYLLDPQAPQTEPRWQPIENFEEAFLPDVWRAAPENLTQQAHGGADGLTLLDFVEAILHDRPIPIDVYRALDITLPGLLSAASAAQEGQPIPVPDYRNQA